VERQATAARLKTGAGRAQIGGLLRAFNRMYRPHAAREDTVLYPAFRAVVSPAEFDALGDSFEDREQKLFGKDGFEKIVAQVAELEKELQLYDLGQFTPRL
jgi:hemerythrin-like domain-containing protein